MSRKLDVTCGTTTMYWRGCRCADCREANRKKSLADRRRKYGEPVQLTPEQRLWAKVQKTETCWLWTASLDGSGYALFKHSRDVGTVRPHRWIYERLVGPIPDGLQLDHLCRVRRCVNPAHLEPVTSQENNRRGRRTHCHRGHQFTDENTCWTRTCKACWKVRKELKRSA